MSEPNNSDRSPADLTSGDISSHVLSIALPASVGFFFNTMFNVTDTWFAGQVSTQALAALSISFPVFFLILAAGGGLSAGATALIGQALGAGNRESAGALARQSILMGLAAGALLGTAGYAAAPWLFTLLGASGEYLEMSAAYMRALFIGGPFFLVTYMANAALNAAGDAKSLRNVMVVTCVLNVGLDPWFIHGGFGLPAMGLTGVAWATLVCQFLSAAYVWRQAWTAGLLGRGPLREWFPGFRTGGRLWRDILAQGGPATVNYLTVGVGIFVITWYVSRFGREAVAAYGVATRVEQIVLLPSIGLNVAALSLTAQNFGAGRLDRVRQTIRAVMAQGACIMALGGLVLLALGGWLMGLFAEEAAVREIGARYLKIAAFVLYAYVILYTHVSCLQGVGRPGFAVWIGLYRQIAAPLAVFPLLAELMGLGILGVWAGVFGVTWSAALVAVWWARRTLAAMERVGAADRGSRK